MARKPETTGEKQGGRFAPGSSGNPAGRPVGARNRTTLAIEALLEGEHEALTRAAIDAAKGGDVAALRLCLDRLAPARRDAAITITLPAVETPADVMAASSAVLAAVAAGQCTPDEGARVMALLTAHRTIIETNELEQRITALEDGKK